jgi:hypothetical protein
MAGQAVTMLQPRRGCTNESLAIINRRLARLTPCACADQGSLGFLGGNARKSRGDRVATM